MIFGSGTLILFFWESDCTNIVLKYTLNAGCHRGDGLRDEILNDYIIHRSESNSLERRLNQPQTKPDAVYIHASDQRMQFFCSFYFPSHSISLYIPTLRRKL